LLEGIVESSIVLKKRKEKEKKKLQRAPSQEGDVQFFPCLHPKKYRTMVWSAVLQFVQNL